MKAVAINVRRYVCANDDCREEIDFVAPAEFGVSKPRCFCGSEMKRAYLKPPVREFSREPDVLRLFADVLPKRKTVE